MLVTYRRNQAQLMEAPASAPASPPSRQGVDSAKLRALAQQVLAEGREMLTEPEARRVLAACGIPVVATRSTSIQPRTVARAAVAIGLPGRAEDPVARHHAQV